MASRGFAQIRGMLRKSTDIADYTVSDKEQRRRARAAAALARLKAKREEELKQLRANWRKDPPELFQASCPVRALGPNRHLSAMSEASVMQKYNVPFPTVPPPVSACPSVFYDSKKTG